MIRCVVTGCAGFIGSHLSEALLARGWRVDGVDAFRDYYPAWMKRRNLEAVVRHPRFRLYRDDLSRLDGRPGDATARALSRADLVFHQAAQAGVRASWGTEFRIYVRDNVQATQRMLEFLKHHPPRLLVYASSSSVYGNSPIPMREGNPTRPISPYGVTKLSAEHLCFLYQRAYGVPVVALRYFTVYGPRQRPDMALHKFIRAVLEGRTIEVYGDGRQTRDFTYVSDAVQANLLAVDRRPLGEVLNIGGGSRVSIRETIRLIERVTGRRARIRYGAKQRGDVDNTWADTTKARRLLGFHPRVGLLDGLRAEAAWLRTMR